MSEPSTTAPRPPQVTVAVGIAMAASVFVVLAVWDRITGLHSLDTRQSLRPLLDAPAFQSSGVTMAQLLVAVKVVSMVSAACATAIVVLGFETLRGSRRARVAMTVLAFPMFVGGLAADGVFSSGAAAAVATLWFGRARAWFDGGTPAPGQQRTAAPPGSPPGRSGPALPPRRPPAQGWAPPPPPPQGQTPPPNADPRPLHSWTPPPTSAYDVPRRRAAARPRSLVVACLVTWAACSLSVLLAGASMLVLALDSQTVLDRMHRQDPQLAGRGITDHQLLVIGYVSGSVVIAWALAAGILGVLAYLGHRWAYYVLLASTAAVVVLCLVAVIGSVLVGVPLVAALATMVLLLRPEVKSWFSG